jgi:transcriptional regulator with XRE-family HTH domain
MEVHAVNLRRERLARGWSQRELANKAGLTRTHVGSVERGEHSTTINVIEALAKAPGSSRRSCCGREPSDASARDGFMVLTPSQTPPQNFLRLASVAGRRHTVPSTG